MITAASGDADPHLNVSGACYDTSPPLALRRTNLRAVGHMADDQVQQLPGRHRMELWQACGPARLRGGFRSVGAQVRSWGRGGGMAPERGRPGQPGSAHGPTSMGRGHVK
ncbi:hypothetical protein NDU88_004252 [Pleurodeles waltl]|uniref:Uncharacterized protein n=1 Tax=Pleurodeles waltl TaxID=8319 RepID=A0AAV7T6X1_PLEWA|nr:hypothetical protein NDU88_004252 [Pleurodeles waltl]